MPRILPVLAALLLLAVAAPSRAEQPAYSIQLQCLTSHEQAVRSWRELRATLPAGLSEKLRAERIQEYVVFRLGAFGERSDAQALLPHILPHQPDALVVRTRLDDTRRLGWAQNGPPARDASAPAAAAATHRRAATPVAAKTRPPERQAAPHVFVGTVSRTVRTAAERPGQTSLAAQMADLLTDGTGMSLSLLTLLAGLTVYARTRRQERTAPAPPLGGPDPDDAPGPTPGNGNGGGAPPARAPGRDAAPLSLSEDEEQRLQRNFSQLATVQSTLLSVAKDARTIYMTSCFHGEGKTQSAVHMAHAFAINNARVLLVDANPRSPRVHERYGCERGPGFTDFIHDEGVLERAVRPTKYRGLFVMPFGGDGDGRPNLLHGKVLGARLERLKQDFDMVVCDGHTFVGSADTPLVAACFDAVAFVAECERTKWDVLGQAQEKCRLLGGRVAGVVLNKRKYYIPRFLYGKI